VVFIVEKAFVTYQFLISYPGVLLMVVLFTEFLKRLIGIKTNQSIKYLALIATIIFTTCSKVLTLLLMDEKITAIIMFMMLLELFANIIIVWFAAMKSYESVIKPYIIRSDTEGD